MSIAEIERFAADLKSDEALRAEAVKAQADKSHPAPLDSMVAFAASKGYAFTADEAKEHAKVKAPSRELADAELSGVAGGMSWSTETSRFSQRDTADLINRYSYANDDPVNKTDPTGH